MTSIFSFDNSKTLVSYAPKKCINVLLHSINKALHRNTKIGLETKKPEAVLFYNNTKSGTNRFDQLCQTYSVARKTNSFETRLSSLGTSMESTSKPCSLSSPVGNTEG